MFGDTDSVPRPWTRRQPARRASRATVPAYLAPDSVAEVRALAELMAVGEWAPSSYRGADGNYAVEKIVLGIMHGAAVGLGPFAAVHAIAVIDGHPTIWGDGALALVERSGLIQDMHEDYASDGEEGLIAICAITRRSWPTPIIRRFSMAMAEGAGLTQKDGPWQTYPRRMLMMRARSWALRDGFADVLRGLSIREEVEDYDTIREPVLRQAHPRSSCGLPLRRPRFADYLAATRTHASRNEMGNAALRAASGDAESANASHVKIEPLPMSLDTALPAMPSDDVASSPYTLVGADGAFIEVADLEALLVAFDDLFSDRSLGANQILGLWESNEIARQQLTEAFGESALDTAVARLPAAPSLNDRQCSTKSAKPNIEIMMPCLRSSA